MISVPPAASADTPAADGRVLLDANLLKQLRKRRGLSQEALAELCFSQQLCVSVASIKRAETGNVVLYRTARHLAQVYGVSIEQLLGQASFDKVPVPAAVLPPALASQLSALQPPADDILRYVILLHIELAAALPEGDALLREAGNLVLQFGGRLEAPEGAGLRAAFGLPQAYRSDAERCMRCAIELNRLLLTHGLRGMAIRLVRWQNGQALPSRDALPDLRGNAPAPGVQPIRLPLYVANNLLPHLKDRFLFDGNALPGYAAFQRVAAGEAGELQALIGRYAETRQFKAVAEAMLEAQGGHIVYLRAMAGVGKSRLAQEFADIARQDGIACHVCDVLDAGGESWRAPLEQLARSLFAIDAQSAVPAEQQIDQTVARLHLPADSAMFYRALCGAPLRDAQAPVFAAMSHEVRERGFANALQMLIVRHALNAPLMITMEDVHWAEPQMLDALAALLAGTRDAPVLWVLTSRVDDDPLEQSLRPQLYDIALTVLDLGPMSPREAAALADQFGDVDAAYRRQCVERAQGNPLFLTQLLASPEHLLPDSLRHVIQTRIDSLPPEQAAALRMASVFGNRFELALLREALAQPDYEVAAGGRNSLLRPAGKDSYAFVHDLVMHCIYDSIEAGALRAMHATVAEIFRERDTAQCAHHLYRARDSGALEMMLAAIRGKLDAHEYEAALNLTAECNRADSTSFSSFPLALLRAHAAAGMGSMANARQYYQHAMMLAGQPSDRIDAVIGLATTLNILEELAEEERLLDETIPLAMSIGADAALGKLLYLKGNIYFPRGNYGECRRFHEDAARYAQASDMAETQARALSGVGDSYYAQGHMRKAHQLFSECLSMCSQHSYLHIEASNRSALGSTRIYLGESAGAVEDALASADIAHKVGNRRAETFARMTAGWALVASGELQRAHEEVQTGLELARSLGSSRFETFLRESEARLAWLNGDHADAERKMRAIAEDVERHQLQNFIGPWVMGTLALFAGDAATRKRALLKGASYLTRDCLAHNSFRFYLNAAEVALLDGDAVSAGFYAEQLEASAASEPCTWIGHHVAMIRAYTEWTGSPNEEVRERFTVLRADAQRYGFTEAAPRLARAMLAVSG